MKDKTEEKQETRKELVVRFNGIGTWTMNCPGRGSKELTPGTVETLNLTDKYELKAALEILKQVNSPRINTQKFIVKGSADGKDTKYRTRFDVLSGIEHLPKILQEVKFKANNFPTHEEMEAVKSLVPDFYEKRK